MVRKRSKPAIIADGRRRAIEGSRRRIQAEVHARYAQELQDSGLFRRVILFARIQLEVHRELGRVAPGDGLYAVGR